MWYMYIYQCLQSDHFTIFEAYTNLNTLASLPSKRLSCKKDIFVKNLMFVFIDYAIQTDLYMIRIKEFWSKKFK